jgi:hypothetical protein
MKRYLLIICILFSAIGFSFSQTSTHITNPNIGARTRWNTHDIYYVDTYLTIGTGASLTISPLGGSTYPVKVIFTDPSYGISVESTGALVVSGTSSRNVIFNADVNDDGVHATGETWQNILFDGSTGTSTISYAIFEYGRGDTYGYGGGLDLFGSNITLRNSTIRYCSTSLYSGGGIYAGPANSIVLENLIIHDNSSAEYGGGLCSEANLNASGLEIYNNSAAVFGDGVLIFGSGTIANSSIHNNLGEGIYLNTAGTSINNCIIYGNTTYGVYFGGAGNLVNSNVINNATGVHSASASAPVLLNSVLWGNTTAQYTGAYIALANCGIQGGFSGGTDGGGNVSLSATNGADTGPNFVSTSSPDYHINSWIAPLVNGGALSYAGVSATTADRDGRTRLSTTDIGAYEFFYYLWTGGTSTDWLTSSNWTGSPASVPTTISENQVIIPNGATYYPTVSSLTLSSRSRVIVEAQASITVTGSTTVDNGCSFLLRSNSTSSANFITGSSVSGSFNVELFLKGGSGSTYNWHYITTPVDGHSKTALTSGIGNTNNLLNYLESVVTTDRMAGWQWHDGYNSTAGFTNLYNKRGYNVLLNNLTDRNALFTGTVLSGQDFTFTNSDLTCGTTDPSNQGWNLIGNPFTSGVNVETFTFGSNVEPIIYYTSGNNYATWNTVTHAFTTFASNYITGMQGFFVHTTTGSNKTLTIPASGRNYSTVPVFKGAKLSADYPILKFNISDGGNSSDDALIYFFKDATAAFDRNYDAYKMLSVDPAYPQIYTTGNNIKLAMNGLPYPDQKTVVPLSVRIGAAKNYTINILNLDNLNDYKVTLVHGDTKVNLKTNPSYTFYAAAGTIDNMSIIFENALTGINDPESDLTACWYSNGILRIKSGQSGFEDNSIVVLYDLNGKAVHTNNNVSLGKGEIIELPVNLSRGIYIVTVYNNYKKFLKKIVVLY